MIHDTQKTIEALKRVHRRIQTVYDKAQLTGDENIAMLAGIDVICLSEAVEILEDCAPRLMTLEEAKSAKVGWFEFWSASSGKHFIEPCVVKGRDVVGYTAVDNTGFGHYCGWEEYNDAYDIFRWRVWTKEPTNKQREETPWTK